LFKENTIHREWVQESHTLSKEKGIIRGLHFQFPPYTEAKLIRAIRGEVFDIFVDLNKGSPTFGKWASLILSDKKKNFVFLPRGLAHGFCTLTSNCELEYKMDNYYDPESAGIIRWNDPDLKINWPTKDPITSERDSKGLSFLEFKEKFGGFKV